MPVASPLTKSRCAAARRAIASSQDLSVMRNSDRAPIRLREDRAAVPRHLGEAAGDEDPLLDLAAVEDGDDARPDLGDERRMAGKDAEIALHARHDNHLHRPADDQPLGRDQLELDLLGHVQAAWAAILRPFSTASSMVPTM